MCTFWGDAPSDSDLMRPGFAGGCLVLLTRLYRMHFDLHIILLCFFWRDITDGLQKAAVVKSIDPFEGLPLDRSWGNRPERVISANWKNIDGTLISGKRLVNLL